MKWPSTWSSFIAWPMRLATAEIATSLSDSGYVNLRHDFPQRSEKVRQTIWKSFGCVLELPASPRHLPDAEVDDPRGKQPLLQSPCTCAQRSLYWSHSTCFTITSRWVPTIRTKFPETDERQRFFYRAPTWSWASARDVVFFDPIRFEQRQETTPWKHAGVLADVTSCSGDSEAGDMSPKSLSILGLAAFLIRGTLTYAKKDEPYIMVRKDSVAQSFCLESVESTIDFARFVVLTDDLNDIAWQGSETMFCPLFWANYDRSGQRCDDRVRGLFIMRTDKVEDGHPVFERVGCGMIVFNLGSTWADLVEALKLKRSTVLLA
ncbi:hypothetical protein CSOJ01_13961 [Colletotrichum sojae]|uniref:Heterokaryon incompatibility protein n=1 Tax=Colletotrichum sojae TaxID=2175907 RepID=A0A8H6IRV2_9PEZI|nr:hypothetical protein CSOJ01_13961 [Colletotrichum sojae]